VAVTDVAGTFDAEVVQNAGIWSMPRYSPLIPGGAASNGYLAYLHARELADSRRASAAYDLVVADRDGSNARVIFPEPGQPALTPEAAFTWGPDGRQIALIYEGNLWVVDVESEVAHQLTLDGSAAAPVWTR
ncbi:MAG: hypothetical protein GYB67_10885, partial [Chloroflexi bacterium]|nr:hypothetical protein [Chloroflexota bacterium]